MSDTDELRRVLSKVQFLDLRIACWLNLGGRIEAGRAGSSVRFAERSLFSGLWFFAFVAALFWIVVVFFVASLIDGAFSEYGAHPDILIEEIVGTITELPPSLWFGAPLMPITMMCVTHCLLRTVARRNFISCEVVTSQQLPVLGDRVVGLWLGKRNLSSMVNMKVVECTWVEREYHFTAKDARRPWLELMFCVRVNGADRARMAIEQSEGSSADKRVGAADSPA